MRVTKAFISAALVLAIGAVSAQSTIETKTGPSARISKNVSIAPQATTIYDRPGKGANGPVPGSQIGSSTSTTYGGAITFHNDIFGGGKKK